MFKPQPQAGALLFCGYLGYLCYSIHQCQEGPLHHLEEKTVLKQYSQLKWFVTWAVRKGYTKQDYIIQYKVKFKIVQKPVIFLTKEELLKVYN